MYTRDYSEMMKNACKMRDEALLIRRGQLDTTTRITALQNDQLMRELEFQSNETQKIIRENKKLSKMVN